MAESRGPARAEPTRWSTTRTPGIGRGPLASPCITTPSTRRASAVGVWARAATAPSTAQAPRNRRRRRRRGLRGMFRRNSEVELPEVFGPQILEVLLQLIRAQLALLG